MDTIIDEAAQRAARVAAGGTYLDVREPGWLHRIDLGRLDLRAPCRCVLGQLAADKHGDVDGWTWNGICGVFGVNIWGLRGRSDYDLGFNAAWPGRSEVTTFAEYDELTAEWRRYIVQRRAAEATA